MEADLGVARLALDAVERLLGLGAAVAAVLVAAFAGAFFAGAFLAAGLVAGAAFLAAAVVCFAAGLVAVLAAVLGAALVAVFLVALAAALGAAFFAVLGAAFVAMYASLYIDHLAVPLVRSSSESTVHCGGKHECTPARRAAVVSSSLPCGLKLRTT